MAVEVLSSNVTHIFGQITSLQRTGWGQVSITLNKLAQNLNGVAIKFNFVIFAINVRNLPSFAEFDSRSEYTRDS